MPIPNKRKDQDPKKFLSTCMGNPTMKKEYPDQKQRVAICIQQSKADLINQADLHQQYATASWDEEWNEFTYEISLAGGVFYEDDRDKTLLGPTSVGEKDKKVTLNKPFRTPGGPKKFSVYVKNEKGNVVKVNFGSPEKDMDIKRDDPERKKSFRARHKCDEQKDRTSPAYWSCKFWSNTKVSDLV
jgi:hypothetical protein